MLFVNDLIFTNKKISVDLKKLELHCFQLSYENQVNIPF